MRACFRTALAVSTSSSPSGGKTHEFRYTPMNDFRPEIEDFSFCLLLEAVSGKKARLENQTYFINVMPGLD